MTLDEDEVDLALMALRHVVARVAAQSADGGTLSGCFGAAKACVDDFCLPRLRALIARIGDWKTDKAEERDLGD